MEHLLKPSLKPLQPIEEVVAKFFLKILPNFVTLKTSTRRCSPCSALLEHKEKDWVDGMISQNNLLHEKLITSPPFGIKWKIYVGDEEFL
jgi:hypothetical protein